MTRKYLLGLGPSLLLGAGIVTATWSAALAAESGWLVMAGPLLLALAITAADAMARRLRGERTMPSPVALILAGALFLAGLVADVRDPNLIMTLIPLVGAGSWVALQQRSATRRRTCTVV